MTIYLDPCSGAKTFSNEDCFLILFTIIKSSGSWYHSVQFGKFFRMIYNKLYVKAKKLKMVSETLKGGGLRWGERASAVVLTKKD